MVLGSGRDPIGFGSTFSAKTAVVSRPEPPWQPRLCKNHEERVMNEKKEAMELANKTWAESKLNCTNMTDAAVREVAERTWSSLNETGTPVPLRAQLQQGQQCSPGLDQTLLLTA